MSQLEQAIDYLVNALKLQSDFKTALVRHFEEYPTEQKALYDYVKNTPVSFSTLPSVVKNTIVEYSYSIQKIAETDVYHLREKEASGCDGGENKDSEFSCNIPIQPTVHLGIRQQMLSIDEGPAQGLSGFISLRILTKTGYLVDSPQKDSQWSLFFGGIKNLLEFFGSQDAHHIAIIDNCDLANDSRRLSRLAGYLRLYGWEPLLILNGNTFPKKNNVLACLKRIAEGSIVHLQLHLDYSSLERIGTHALCETLNNIRDILASLTISYILDPQEKSRELLQRFLAEPDFNNACLSVYTRMRGNVVDSVILKDSLFSWFQHTSLELVVDTLGTLRLCIQGNQVAEEAQLFGPDWKNKILQWHHLYKGALNHA